MLQKTLVRRFRPWYAGHDCYKLPGDPTVTKEEVRGWRFNTSREPFGYSRVDDFVNSTSEFRKPRKDFDEGPRQDNSGSNYARYTNPPKYTQLHEYFDEYTKPGEDPKMAALRAVQEFWDQEEFYYQGEAWKRNRPAFRSVPQEILNKQTWYHFTNWVLKGLPEMSAAARPRTHNPIWPPPGYKLPQFCTKKEFQFGADDPGLICEIERWVWHRIWIENIARIGPWEIPVAMFGFWCMFYQMRAGQDNLNMIKVMAGAYFPGQHMIRAWGEPKDPVKEGWWWQKPLEEFPNKGDIYFLRAVRFGYIDYIKKRDEERALKKAAEAAAAAA